MEAFEIHSIKIPKNDNVEVVYKKTNPDGSEVDADDTHNKNGKSKPHPDFRRAIDGLAVHAAIILDYIPSKSVKSIETTKSTSKEMDLFVMRGFNLTGSDATEGVQLHGSRQLSVGGVNNFTTPPVRFNVEAGTGYQFVDDLAKAVAAVKEECIKYLGGKYEEDAQGSLDLKEKAENDAQAAS